MATDLQGRTSHLRTAARTPPSSISSVPVASRQRGYRSPRSWTPKKTQQQWIHINILIHIYIRGHLLLGENPLRSACMHYLSVVTDYSAICPYAVEALERELIERLSGDIRLLLRPGDIAHHPSSHRIHQSRHTQQAVRRDFITDYGCLHGELPVRVQQQVD